MHNLRCGNFCVITLASQEKVILDKTLHSGKICSLFHFQLSPFQLSCHIFFFFFFLPTPFSILALPQEFSRRWQVPVGCLEKETDLTVFIFKKLDSKTQAVCFVKIFVFTHSQEGIKYIESIQVLLEDILLCQFCSNLFILENVDFALVQIDSLIV